MYGLGRIGLGAQVGDACTTAAGQPGNVQEWYDADMGMVVGMICTTDPPGTRIYRHSSGPTSSFSDPNPVPVAPTVGGAPSGPVPPPIPVTRLDPGPVPPIVNLAPPPELMPSTGAPLAMPSNGGGGGGSDQPAGLTFAQGVGAVAAIVAAAYLLRKH